LADGQNGGEQGVSGRGLNNSTHAAAACSLLLSLLSSYLLTRIRVLRGRVLSDLFVQLPNKREWPDYYKLIAHPISLEIIKDNIDNNKYTTLEAVLADLDLCFNNARKFNEEESPIHKDAKLLQVRSYFAAFAPYSSDSLLAETRQEGVCKASRQG
jgi:DNA-binding cell septation regulator SpoVG